MKFFIELIQKNSSLDNINMTFNVSSQLPVIPEGKNRSISIVKFNISSYNFSLFTFVPGAYTVLISAGTGNWSQPLIFPASFGTSMQVTSINQIEYMINTAIASIYTTAGSSLTAPAPYFHFNGTAWTTVAGTEYDSISGTNSLYFNGALARIMNGISTNAISPDQFLVYYYNMLSGNEVNSLITMTGIPMSVDNIIDNTELVFNTDLPVTRTFIGQQTETFGNTEASMTSVFDSFSFGNLSLSQFYDRTIFNIDFPWRKLALLSDVSIHNFHMTPFFLNNNGKQTSLSLAPGQSSLIKLMVTDE